MLSSSPRNVWIVQDYVPAYRAVFFQKLKDRLVDFDIVLHLVSGLPNKIQAKRNDGIDLSWQIHVNMRNLRLGSKTIHATSTRKYWKNADAVILPLMGSWLDAYIALMQKKVRVGLWGHARSYTAKVNQLDSSLEIWQMKRAHRIFAYTESGMSYALSTGVDADRILSINNSIDTDAIEKKLNLIQGVRLGKQSSPLHNLVFLGGLDSSKRIEFLVEALEILKSRGSSFHLTVLGDGEQSYLLKNLTEEGFVSLQGFGDDQKKAEVLSTATALLSPGRVGLLAIDALASGVPILTTDWKFHAPEFEYLTEGESVFMSKDSPVDFADLVQSFGSASKVMKRWEYPTLDQMVERFALGIREMLS